VPASRHLGLSHPILSNHRRRFHAIGICSNCCGCCPENPGPAVAVSKHSGRRTDARPARAVFDSHLGRAATPTSWCGATPTPEHHPCFRAPPVPSRTVPAVGLVCAGRCLSRMRRTCSRRFVRSANLGSLLAQRVRLTQVILQCRVRRLCRSPLRVHSQTTRSQAARTALWRSSN
jgi:hypothetical protein